MKEKMFHELLESVQQAGAIMRGEMEPGRRFVVEKPDVKLIRSRLGPPGPTLQLCLGSASVR